MGVEWTNPNTIRIEVILHSNSMFIKIFFADCFNDFSAIFFAEIVAEAAHIASSYIPCLMKNSSNSNSVLVACLADMTLGVQSLLSPEQNPLDWHLLPSFRGMPPALHPLFGLRPD